MRKLASVVFSILIAAGKTHDMKGTVVSVDAKANTLTFTDDKGEHQGITKIKKA